MATEAFLAILILVLALAWANGANDVSKGIATLVGSGSADAKRAVIWGTFWTVMGGLAAALWGGALVSAFSHAFVTAGLAADLSFVACSVLGAAAWVGAALWIGLPVSTTHALLGGVVGAALPIGGVDALELDAIAHKAALPLLVSPLLAIILCVAMLRAVSIVRRKERSKAREVGTAGVSLHWLSSGATSFARALNDVPKIAAFLILASSIAPVTPLLQSESTFLAIVLVTIAMAVGSLWGGFRVLRVLAYQVATVNSDSGVVANLGTSLLVLAASPLGLPVSTTHVSSGALIGVRLAGKKKPKQDALKNVLFGWIVTLPVAAAFAATATRLISFS